MDKQRKLIIAGNWKMNKTVAEAAALVEDLKIDLGELTEVDVVVCPPFTTLAAVSGRLQDSNIRLGAQNINENDYGAHTGEIAAGMLKELLVRYVILGHSERRQDQAETNDLVNRKTKAALAAGLKPILCVGETLKQRETGNTEKVVGEQIRGSLTGLSVEQLEETVIAYEPVWAIGTGKTATAEQAQEMHAFIRSQLDVAVAKRVRIQYGGSVKPANAAELLSLPDVDGALVGGASLEAYSFIEIVKSTLE